MLFLQRWCESFLVAKILERYKVGKTSLVRQVLSRIVEKKPGK